ncbi:hypothetical protein EDL99_08505 [Ornithobacterium rhinotracheale]|uniref:hypothetical protein n=1 Tax=Ornithobacterium rhinotracheale TaxID=28251 RepID=UPI00129CA27E|nr:hypothetical protein [Ornithobacterium rhinotracheale]MRJ08902.1 hypothetical protein [Ornithobacterium rhinotracheale]UOH77785.1 hypothetical protein MT996_11355 [Ornithobacterium rhinotracheale]
MAKKSFVGGLAKGFVRSAVNQVGRDGGKVISNSIYGDKHANPIRFTGQQNSQNIETEDEISLDNSSLERISTNLTLWDYTKFAIALFLGIIIPFLWSAGLFIYGFLKRRQTTTTYKVDGIVSRKIPDKRCSLGYRVEQYRTKVKQEAPSTDDEMNYFKLKGTIYMSIALASILISALIAYLID